jgi:putative CocE/NonD family hydrolase
MKGALFLSAFFLLLQLNLHAQKLYFPRVYYKDSTAFAEAIPQLAKDVIVQYKEPGRMAYFDNVRRYALVAEDYELSIIYLDSVRNLMKAGDSTLMPAIGIQWEAYARTRMLQKKEQGSFESIFTRVFDSAYNHLNPGAKAAATMYAVADIADLKKSLDKQKNKSAASDSLNLDDARTLVAAFNVYNVYRQTSVIMQRQIAVSDEKEFVIRKERIITRDGSTVQAVVVYKKGDRMPLPAVFVFNIYADEPFDLSFAKRYAVKGYVGVVANTRGKGASPQDIEPFEHDAKDAYDIIDWISKQSWSNGKVGMVGGSYLGFAQWSAAKTLHPALKTIMPQVAVGIGIDYPMAGNVFMSYMLRWIHFVTNNKGTDDEDFGNSDHWNTLYRKWYREGRAFRSMDTLDGRPSNIFQRWLQHPSFDSYWQNMVAYGNDFSKIKIPVLTTTGYFDDDQNGALYYFRQHYLHHPDAEHYLVIGPYTHGGAQRYPTAEVSTYKVDSAAIAFNFVDLSVQWFNYVLKDSLKPALLQDKVNYEVMGANTWKHAPSLNAMSNTKLRLYISNTRLDEYYKLSSTGSGKEYINHEVDLASRKDSSEREYELIDSTISHNDMLSFISVPFEQSVMVNGAFTAQLQLAINKKDADLVVKLYELMPDGRYFDLGTALQRASYAKDRSKRQLLRPGKKESIPMTTAFVTAKQIQKGSRLVVVVGINKSPDWQINYGTGKDVSDETIEDAGEPLHIKWYTDSYIDIPLWK